MTKGYGREELKDGKKVTHKSGRVLKTQVCLERAGAWTPSGPGTVSLLQRPRSRTCHESSSGDGGV